jgi:hypothetical protein
LAGAAFLAPSVGLAVLADHIGVEMPLPPLGSRTPDRKRWVTLTIKTTVRDYAHVLNDDVRRAKAEVQEAQAASPTVQKLQGRSNLKLVG